MEVECKGKVKIMDWQLRLHNLHITIRAHLVNTVDQLSRDSSCLHCIVSAVLHTVDQYQLSRVRYRKHSAYKSRGVVLYTSCAHLPLHSKYDGYICIYTYATWLHCKFICVTLKHLTSGFKGEIVKGKQFIHLLSYERFCFCLYFGRHFCPLFSRLCGWFVPWVLFHLPESIWCAAFGIKTLRTFVREWPQPH